MKKTPHPAKYSNELLPVLAKYAYGHILDIMGGTGKAGRLKEFNPRIRHVTTNELEREWALQGHDNGVDRIIIGDARKLSGQYDCIVTSPPYGNRMADNFKAGKPDSMRRRYVGDLGRQVSEGSACCAHFGRGYEDMMRDIYDAVIANVRFDRFVLNVSNFIRQFKEVDVIGWYKSYFRERGFNLIREEQVVTRRQKGVGANTELRVAHEVVMVFEQTPNLTGRKTGEDKTEKQNKGETNMIEVQLKRIADALEAIANLGDGETVRTTPKESTSDLAIPAMQEAAEAPAPKKAKKAKEEPAKELTTEDIGAALRAFVTVNGKDKAVAILKSFNASRLSEIKPEDFGKVLSALKV